MDSSTTLRPFGPRVTPTTLASLSTPFCIFFNAAPSCALKYKFFAAAVTESGARAWRVVRRTLTAIGLPTSFNPHHAHPSSVTCLSRVTRPPRLALRRRLSARRKGISLLLIPIVSTSRAIHRARASRTPTIRLIAYISTLPRASHRGRVSRARRRTHRRARASWRRRSWRWRCVIAKTRTHVVSRSFSSRARPRHGAQKYGFTISRRSRHRRRLGARRSSSDGSHAAGVIHRRHPSIGWGDDDRRASSRIARRASRTRRGEEKKIYARASSRRTSSWTRRTSWPSSSSSDGAVGAPPSLEGFFACAFISLVGAWDIVS